MLKIQVRTFKQPLVEVMNEKLSTKQRYSEFCIN